MPIHTYVSDDGEQRDAIVPYPAPLVYEENGKVFHWRAPMFNTPSAPSRERRAQNIEILKEIDNEPNRYDKQGRTTAELVRTGELGVKHKS